MSSVLRQATLLALAAFLSWWVLLRVPSDSTNAPRALLAPPPPLEVTPLVRELPRTVSSTEVEAQVTAPAPAADPAQSAAAPASGPEDERSLPEVVVAVPASAAESPEASLPPPPRLGVPEANRLAAATPEPAPEESAAPSTDPVASSEESVEPADEELADPAPAPPPAELGTPEGDEQGPPPSGELAGGDPLTPAEPEERAAPELERVPADDPSALANEARPSSAGRPAPGTPASERAAAARGEVETLMSDPGLLADARAEFSGGNKRGFATVLLAAPEDQLAIARFFGEELVLVPRRALDPELVDPRYFRVADSGEPRVVEVESAPPLEGFRQYRDLFDYEYKSLPQPLQELRRSVAARTEIYLFAALLSAEEWALVIARRQDALVRAGRGLEEVRRFVLRYRELAEGAFDLAVDEIVFADGTRFRPGERGTGDRR